MAELVREKCVACRRDSPRVTESEMKELGAQIPQWTVTEYDAVPRLEKVFKFPNFVQALEFTNRVGAMAEEQGHHPALLTEWGRVKVSWWTHKIRGLHRNDFIMAAKTDEAAAQAGAGPKTESVSS
jgi:4a-hydroxytetrahydrobiopterin dehydratase